MLLASDLALPPAVLKDLHGYDPQGHAEAIRRARLAPEQTPGRLVDWAMRLVQAPQACDEAEALAAMACAMDLIPLAQQESAKRALVYAVGRRDEEAHRLAASLQRLEVEFLAEGDRFCARAAQAIRIALVE